MKDSVCRVFGMFLLLTLPIFTGCATWRTAAEGRFDDRETHNTSLIETDPGLKWSVQDGVGRFAGVSSDTRWKGNHIVLSVTNDNRAMIEISGDFKIAKSQGYQLIALWGIVAGERDTDGPLCLYFEGSNGEGQYIIQTRWMNIPATVKGEKRNVAGFGDETQRFHKMRVVLNRTESLIAYFVDNRKVGTVKYEGEIAPITKVQMDIETPTAGTALEILYKNLKARSAGPPYSWRETSQRR
ncbi:MAG: hypothetical protein V1929_06025 [bacterium]